MAACYDFNMYNHKVFREIHVNCNELLQQKAQVGEMLQPVAEEDYDSGISHIPAYTTQTYSNFCSDFGSS